MRISRVKVHNYRNIDGIEVLLNPECNYIIGENNLGKSNFLAMLSTVCSGKGFDERDFFDSEKSIEIEIDVHLLPNEQGFFGDNFCPEDASIIRIRYSQAINDAYPTIVSVDSNEGIQSRQMRKLNFIKYETTSTPNKELRLNTQKGIGLLVDTIIERYHSDGEEHIFLNAEQVTGLAAYINDYLDKIKGFRDYSIRATVAPQPAEMLSNLFYLSDGERKIETTGSGVQYMSMASIAVLGQIMEIYKSKAIAFSDLLYTSPDGKRYLPLILSIDEPEVHLHPYLQRSLINYYKRILQNKDEKFAELLKDLFDIDGLSGQLIVVTHSTDALIGDYRNLVRFYKNTGKKTSVISGYSLRPIPGGDNRGRIKSEIEKHLIMRFPEIKEAFYSKCAILIEGETEYGCIFDFAQKAGASLDDNSICVINAGGEHSIQPIRQLLELFAIPSVAIYDRDVEHGHTHSTDEFYTTELCFEIEIVKSLYTAGKLDIIKQIALDIDNRVSTMVLDANLVKSPFKKMGISVDGYVPKKLSEVDDANADEFCNMYSAWYMVKKGILLGRIVGDTVPAANVPTSYSRAILRAQEVAQNV